jgi:methylmalonyl-CoA mutase N-terminal domain/subunit
MNSIEDEKKFTTESGISLKKVYSPEDIAGLDYERDLGKPGEAPYTRGPMAFKVVKR